MKNYIISTTMITIMLMIAISVKAVQWQSSGNAFSSGVKTPTSLNVTFTLPEYEINSEAVDGVMYQKITLKDAGYYADEGSPKLPYLSTMIAIPNHGQVSVEVLDTRDTIMHHYLPFPVQKESFTHTKRDFKFNTAVYESGQKYPRDEITCSEPQIMRDFRVIQVQIQPFVWDSATHQLLIRDHMEFRLNFSDQPGANEINEPLRISPAFDKIYRSLLLNYDDFRNEAALLAHTPSRIVVIHGNYADATFQQKLNNFAIWKRQKGSDVRLVSTAITGTTNTAIKNYLQTLYNDPNSRPDYVIIVGDTQGSFLVPTWTNNGSGDYPYQQLAGADLLGDCFLGRISAENTSQLDVIFSKIYAYEKNLNMANASFLNRLLIVSDTAHDGISVIYLGRYIQELAQAFNPDYTFTMLLQNGPTPQAMNAAISEGVGFFNYRGYAAMSGWSPSETLTNVNKPCHAVIITCGTGSFYGQVATTEAFIRLGTAAAPKGAVTAIGMDTLETHTMPNNCLSGAIFDGIYARGMRTMGEALLNSKLYMASIYQNTQPAMLAAFTHWCNLMGDPTMEVYIGIPDTFTANLPETMALGTPNLDVIVTDQNGEAVNNACVTITQNNLILDRTYTNQSGFAYLTINDGLIAGNAIVTISRHDFKPLQQTVAISSTGSIVAGTSLYDDDALGNSIGNNNDSPNSGERLEVLFSIKNTSQTVINGVTGFVASDANYISVIDSLVTFGNIAPGTTLYSLAPALVQISPSCPDRYFARLRLHLTDSNNLMYEVQDDILVTDALLRFESYQVMDTQNQVLDPGETVNLSITLKNEGSISIDDVSGELYTLNHLVSVEDASADFGYIAVGGQATCTNSSFSLIASEQVLPGMQIPMRIKLTNPQGYIKWVDFALNVGVVSVTSPLGPDNYGYVIYDDGDLSYPECPVYQWVGIAPAEGGTGTSLAISDAHTGTEGDALGAQSLSTVTLPFTFQYYGQDYTQITVCSNGFLVMGVTQDASFRNYHLPGAVGPAAMIAPFWDDLSTAAGSGIYTWFDPVNHVFIIEWYQMKNGYQTSANETFQVILYDPAFYQTSLGDGPIKIQYHTFNNVDSGTGNQEHGVYSTIGIQDHLHQNGLEYSFNNHYPLASRALANGRCIYITNAPINAQVPDLSIASVSCTDINGDEVPEPGETLDISIQLLNSGAAATQNGVAMLTSTDPFVAISISEAVYPTLSEGGFGDNVTPFRIYVSPDCPGNHVMNFTLDVMAEAYLKQLHFQVTVEKPELHLISYYLNDLSGNNNGIADPNEDCMLILNVGNLSPSVALNVVGNLTSENSQIVISNPVFTKLYLSQDNSAQFVFPVHWGDIPNGTSIPFNMTYSAENTASGTFSLNVICGNGTPIRTGIVSGTVSLSTGADPTQAMITTDNHFGTNPDSAGSYAFYLTPGEYSLDATMPYYYCAESPTVVISDTELSHIIDISLGYLANPDELSVSGMQDDPEAHLTWIAPPDPVFPVLRYRIYRRSETDSYAMLSESVSTSYIDNLSSLEGGVYTYYITALYSGGESAPSNFVSIAYPFVPSQDGIAPLIVNALHPNYPNPFNPHTSISYDLKEKSDVRLNIYNTKGQLVRKLVDEPQSAGHHLIVWNGIDSTGQKVSSGLYLYKIQSGNYSATRKMIMMK